MAYETSIPGTPGGWNTAFATAPNAEGPWTVLDSNIYRMALDVEHADPAIRYIAEDSYWYCIPARKSPVPAPNGGWYFFTVCTTVIVVFCSTSLCSCAAPLLLPTAPCGRHLPATVFS